MSEYKKIQTPEFRLVFPNVFVPRAFEGSTREMYSILMVFPKGTDLSALKAICREAFTAKFPRGASGARSPICNGDDKVDEWGDVFKDAIYVRASSTLKPGVCDRRKTAITDPDAVYSGQFARAIVHAFAYDVKGNKGVSIGLDALQILRDGEPLGGGAAAAGLFDELEDNDDFGGGVPEGTNAKEPPAAAASADGGLFD